MLLGSSLAALLGLAELASEAGLPPTEASASDASAPASDTIARPITAVVLDADQVDAELRAELELRASARDVVASDTIVELPAARFVWLSVAWIDDERARLELVDTDGRAYERVVTAPPAQLRRALAGTAASMMAAIERGEIAADRTGVAIPRPSTPPKPPPDPVPQPATIATSAPVPKRAEAPPRWELGPHASGLAVLGLGPPLDLDGFVAGGGALGVDARHRSGALVGGAARVLGHRRDALAIVRVRVAVTGGYAWRRGAFELLARAGVSVEPILLRDHGARAHTITKDGTTTSRAPLVGALASLAPGLLVRRGRGHPPLRLSLELELAGAMEARRTPGVARFIDASASPPVSLLRAGGLELALGLGVGGWFAL